MFEYPFTAQMKKEELESANFFVPMLINEIKEYYSDLVLDEDENKLLIEFTLAFVFALIRTSYCSIHYNSNRTFGRTQFN